MGTIKIVQEGIQVKYYAYSLEITSRIYSLKTIRF
jgi:hypothetical protein